MQQIIGHVVHMIVKQTWSSVFPGIKCIILRCLNVPIKFCYWSQTVNFLFYIVYILC